MKVCLNNFINFFKTFASVFVKTNNFVERKKKYCVMASTITSFSKEDLRAVTMAGTDQKTDLTNGRAVN